MAVHFAKLMLYKADSAPPPPGAMVVQGRSMVQMTKQSKMTTFERKIDALWTDLYSLRLPGLVKRYRHYAAEAMSAPNARAEWEAWRLQAIVRAYARRQFAEKWEAALAAV